MSDNIIHDNQYQAGPTYKIAISSAVVELGGVTHLTKIQPTSGTFSGKSATAVWIHCMTSGIYFTPGGTNPDVSGNIGHPLEVGALLNMSNWDNIKNLKFIRQGSVDGAIMLTPFFNMA